MTRDEILTLEPGRELDALVAEKVMRYRNVDVYHEPNEYLEPSGLVRLAVRSYSTDISAAWEVVEKMRETTYFRTGAFSSNAQLNDYVAWFDNKQASAPTAPEAICKAALLVVLS